jgi:endonuclease-3
MNKKNIAEIFSRWQTQNPQPTTELIYHSDYQLLVAVILSAQSTDKVVNQVTEKLFVMAPTAEKMIELDLETISHCIKRLGLYQQKAKAILTMSQILVRDYQGHIPQTREALEALPGVGRKTANVVLNTAFQIPVIAVDTHIFRLSHRLGFSKGKTPLAVEQDLIKIIPQQYRLDAHHWMILHGRYICQAKKPQCQSCLIADLCPYFKKNRSSF